MSKSAQIDNYVYSTRLIGKGSFSRVYKGFNIETDEIIAIKIIDKNQLKKGLVQRLYDEIELLKQLDHPSVVQLRDFLEDHENFYLVFEYCAGGDLAYYIKRGALTEEKTRDYMKQLAIVLEYLRYRNIVHRDLKPQNILLTRDHKTLKITDFNFAKELYDDDLTSTMCGSPLYMAPEIIEKQEYCTSSDLWSVGMILYEMVYGHTPYYDACNLLDLIKKIKNRPILYAKQVSSECNNLLQGLLQKDPDKRISWETFFNHPWLNVEEPTFVNSSPATDMWESISLSTISPFF